MAEETFRVAELFAGVGGFRLGLEGVPSEEWESEHTVPHAPNGTGFRVVFGNQWEPGTMTQHAADVYAERWSLKLKDEGQGWRVFESEDGDVFSNEDIHRFTDRVVNIQRVPDFDVLVGGFPCQDYSVARTTSGELGIKGEKGKLWHPIKRMIGRMNRKGDLAERPKVVLLENVPRLLNSPAGHRGLNFHKIVDDFLTLGYEVEWRVINASEYGMPQQRSRVFIIGYRTHLGGGFQGKQRYNKGHFGMSGPPKTKGPMEAWMFGECAPKKNENWDVGPFGQAFPAKGTLLNGGKLPLPTDLEDYDDRQAPFGNCGYAWKGQMGSTRWVKQFMAWRAKPPEGSAETDSPSTLGQVIIDKQHASYDEGYELDKETLEPWEYAKSEKKEYRIRKNAKDDFPELWETYQACLKSQDQAKWDQHKHEFEEYVSDGTMRVYRYQEGQIAYPDHLDVASRTVITAEIGSTPSRTRHLIKTPDGTWRRLFPVELERLNQFPDDWTKLDGITDSRRGFLMGNALVVGIIERLREPLYKLLKERSR